MNRSTLVRRVGMTLALALFLCWLPVSADETCTQACYDQWQSDKQVCTDTLNARLAQIDVENQQCLAKCGPTDYRCQGKCERARNIERAVAQNAFKRCVNHANLVGWNCYRSCEHSRTRP